MKNTILLSDNLLIFPSNVLPGMNVHEYKLSIHGMTVTSFCVQYNDYRRHVVGILCCSRSVTSMCKLLCVSILIDLHHLRITLP